MSAEQPETRLHPRWHALAGRIGLAPGPGTALLDELMQAYAQPGRHYHNLAHIAALIELLDRHGDNVAQPRRPRTRDSLPRRRLCTNPLRQRSRLRHPRPQAPNRPRHQRRPGCRSRTPDPRHPPRRIPRRRRQRPRPRPAPRPRPLHPGRRPRNLCRLRRSHPPRIRHRPRCHLPPRPPPHPHRIPGPPPHLRHATPPRPVGIPRPHQPRMGVRDAGVAIRRLGQAPALTQHSRVGLLFGSTFCMHHAPIVELPLPKCAL